MKASVQSSWRVPFPKRSAGLDLNILLGKSEQKVRGLVQELYVRLHDAQYNLGKPSIAAIGGAARGGGMTMAISCDVILAGQSATFGYPEIDVGVIPAIHFVHLPRIVGRHRAFELLFTGSSFGSEEANRLWLDSSIVPDEELDSHTQGLAETFAAKSAIVMNLGRYTPGVRGKAPRRPLMPTERPRAIDA
jgi:enoyl-CoA hydratase